MSKGALKVKTPDGFRVVGSGLVTNTEDVTGVSSFNARTGTVIPQKGDYSADMIAFSDGETFQQKYDSGELKGQDGHIGKDGSDGVGIASVTQTTTSSADGGENVVTVTLTNGTKSTFKFKNGSKGSDGTAGKDGANGKDGTDGKTPVKGTDYFTDADKAEMVADVVEQIGDIPTADHTHKETDVTITDATDYTTCRVRGIALAQDEAISVPEGCLCGVYTIS